VVLQRTVGRRRSGREKRWRSLEKVVMEFLRGLGGCCVKKPGVSVRLDNRTVIKDRVNNDLLN
jgi:hypothetical protein